MNTRSIGPPPSTWEGRANPPRRVKRVTGMSASAGLPGDAEGWARSRPGSWVRTLVELPQCRARVDPQLVAEQVADEHEAVQGFGLAPAAVERQHQLAPAPLPRSEEHT